MESVESQFLQVYFNVPLFDFYCFLLKFCWPKSVGLSLRPYCNQAESGIIPHHLTPTPRFLPPAGPFSSNCILRHLDLHSFKVKAKLKTNQLAKRLSWPHCCWPRIRDGPLVTQWSHLKCIYEICMK